MTLRDLSAEGGLHRINLYFYDNWADDYSHLKTGDELAISGPGVSLVRPDPSAGSGDHPSCLIFHSALDDTDIIGPAEAPVPGSYGGGSSAGWGDDVVTCEVIKAAGQVTRGRRPSTVNGNHLGGREMTESRGGGAEVSGKLRENQSNARAKKGRLRLQRRGGLRTIVRPY